MPLPCSFVVKNGSNRCCLTYALMPMPLSLTINWTYSPGTSVGFFQTSASVMIALPVSIVSLPPVGIASRALIARLTSTCSI